MITLRKHADELPGEMLFVVPSPRSYVSAAFLCFFLMCWACGEYAFLALGYQGICHAIHNGFNLQLTTGIATAVIVFGFPMWTVGGVIIVHGVLWNIAGREVVSLNQDRLRVEVHIPPFVRTRQYVTNEISLLRVLPECPDRSSQITSRNGQAFGTEGGRLAFNYRGTVARFGMALDVDDGYEILRDIAAEHPSLVANADSKRG